MVFAPKTFYRCDSEHSSEYYNAKTGCIYRFRQWSALILSASKVKNRNGVPELQIIVSFNKPDEAQSLYKERWQIETAFKALKTSGFNIEDTHLTDIDRINKLFALVMVAFVWACLPVRQAYKAGIFLKALIPIKIKKH